MLENIQSILRDQCGLTRDQPVVVGVSGGPDSVALLSLLHHLSRSWRLSLRAAHFNYGLRGRESDEDERFVTALCRALAAEAEVGISTRSWDPQSGKSKLPDGEFDLRPSVLEVDRTGPRDVLTPSLDLRQEALAHLRTRGQP